MSCCRSQYAKQNADIEEMLKEESKTNTREYKLLLLGAGESGKSTIAKQMQIIHNKERPFSEAELLEFVPVIHNNIIQSLVSIVEYLEAKGNQLRSKNKDYRNELFEFARNSSCRFDEEFGLKMREIVDDKAFQSALKDIHKFDFPERVLLFFNDIERISQADYVPTIDDVLSARRHTTGVRESIFRNASYCYRMIDVGGQKSERKRWIHFFDDVTAVIYVVALSEYNINMFEDPTKNRMKDSLELFKEISNSKWFESSTMMLFLNKTDLFAEKIRKIPLKVCFESYTGANEYEPALNYVRKKFLTVREKKKTIFVHATCATDTKNVRIVFAAVEDSILHRNIESVF